VELVESELAKLQKKVDRRIYRIVKDEIGEYLAYMREDLSKPLNDFLIGYRTSVRRVQLKLDTAQLAELLGTDQTSINAIERGDDGVSVERLIKICDVLKVSPSYILGFDNVIDDEDLFISSVKAYTLQASDAEKKKILRLIEVVLEN